MCFVAIGAAAVMFDARHSRLVFDHAALKGKLLLDRLFDDARFAHDVQRGEPGLLVVQTQRIESSFRFDDGLAAFITLGDEVLWQSDEPLGAPSSAEPPVPGQWNGIGTISYADRTHEAYLVRTAVREWPVPASTGESPGAERPPETYAVTYHVALLTQPYRLEIMEFRTDMAVVVAVAMVVFGGAMYVVMRRQLRPLARMTRRVGELEAWSGQRIQGGDGDPREIRTLTERFNEFLRKLDDAGGWERTCHGRLRTVLQVAERELAPESEINQRGFMHSLSHLLSAIPLTEFKTIPEAEKEAAHRDFMRVRSMIERKLHDLVSADAGPSARSADVVAVATDFFARRGHGEENFMQSFMRRRHQGRSFHLGFELRHEDAPLLARIDRSDLYELMFNLLHNAGKAAQAQVRMTIARRAGRCSNRRRERRQAVSARRTREPRARERVGRRRRRGARDRAALRATRRARPRRRSGARGQRRSRRCACGAGSAARRRHGGRCRRPAHARRSGASRPAAIDRSHVTHPGRQSPHRRRRAIRDDHPGCR